MVTLASMFVLSEYLTSKDGQHSSGKLRVRRLQIRIVPEQFLNHCEVNVFLVSEDCGDGQSNGTGTAEDSCLIPTGPVFNVLLFVLTDGARL